MSVTFGAAGAITSGTASTTPGYPTGITAGDKLLLLVASGEASDTIPDTPAGWAFVGSVSGGAGTFGLDTGVRRETAFAKNADGTETGTVTVTIGGSATGRVISARIVRFSRTLDAWGPVTFTTGTQAADSTAYSVTGAADPGGINGSHIVAASAWHPDTAAQSSFTLAWSGTGSSAVTGRTADPVTNGNQLRHVIQSRNATGTSTGAPTYNATLSATGSGATLFVVLTDTAKTAHGSSTSTGTSSGGGGGRKRAHGSAAATATSTAAGGGRKRAHGSSTTTATSSCAGTGRKRGHGSSTTTGTSSTAGIGRKRGHGGSSCTAACTTAGAGRRRLHGSSTSTATSSVTAGGRKRGHGSSTCTATTSALGTGHRPPRHGSSTSSATSSTTGSGRARRHGASNCPITITGTGGTGHARHHGGSTATAHATTTGVGHPSRDLTLTTLVAHTRTLTITEHPTRTTSSTEHTRTIHILDRS